MKKLVLLIIALFTLVSCSRQPTIINIGYNNWIGYDAVVIAEAKHFFEQEGVNVKLHYFTSLYDVMRAFADGNIDVMFSTTNEVFLLADKGEKLKIVLMADYSNGADAIVAQKSIHSLQDLKGKGVGVEIGSISHFTLLKALEKAHLTENDVKLSNTTGKEALDAFSKGSLDAIVTWSPIVGQAIAAGGHTIFSSREIPGQIVDVLAIRQNLIDTSPTLCFKIVAAYLKTLDWFNTHQQEGLQIVSKTEKIDSLSLADDLKNVQITRLKENLIGFGTPQQKGTLYPVTQQLITFLFKNKLIASPLNANNFIDPTFVWQYENTHTP